MNEEQEPGRGVYRFSEAERQELALALLARPQRIEEGRAALRRKYPSAPDEMINTASHHLYVDGPGAVVDFLAEAELAIRDAAYEVGYGTSWHLLHHVYNWLQFRALIPEGKSDVLDLLSQMEQAVAENDPDFVLATVKELRDVIDGNRGPPDFDVP